MTEMWEARRLVAEGGRRLLAEGLTARTWGNISARAGENRMAITPSGLSYETMTPEDIVCVDMATGAWEGGHKPSSEKGIHLAAYQVFPQAGFVIHTHQTYASALGLAGFDRLPITEAEHAALGGIALAEYALPGTKKLAAHVTDAFLAGARVVLLARHGAVIVGKDADEAFARARLLEQICRRSCRGQCDVFTADQELTERCVAAASWKFGSVRACATAATLCCAAEKQKVYAQLDDMAQIIGPVIPAAEPEETALLRALEKTDVVLVKGVGALCRAKTAEDCQAQCLLADKACAAWLHTRALGVKSRLPLADVYLMRGVYLQKYAKQMGEK